VTILDRILETKKTELVSRKATAPLSKLREAAARAPSPRSFFDALASKTAGFRVVAEVKKASPSKGVIREDFDPVGIARAYERGGAAAISILTDEQYFQGRLDFLEAIRPQVGLPILRKDFVIDVYQVWEARAAGADAILLILAALEDSELRELSDLADHLDMDVLWEVHNLDELRRLNTLGPRVVGINNRDLKTFDVSLETTKRLLPEVPDGALVVSESGFFEHSELEMMGGWGVDAFLIGESLMRSPDPGLALRDLIAGGGQGGAEKES